MASKHSACGRRKKHSAVAPAILLVVSAAFIVGVVWLLLGDMGDTAGDTPTSTATAATTTVTTIGSTTTATTTTTTATTTAPSVGQPTLLQYDPTGRYVQQSVPDWKLRLVNDWNAIDENYEKGIKLVAAGNRNQKVDSRILADLNAMLAAGKAYGIDVQSGYRAYSHQATLYWRQVNAQKSKGYDDVKAQEIAGTIVKRPGYSEHNSGLAVDLGGSGNFNLDESFENTAAYRWLIENCAEYGFVLRFPKNKEAVTGVIYEAWHFRYVGKEAAKEMMEKGLCLEEYLAQNG